MAKNKTLKVLSTGTAAGMIAAAVLSSQAFAAVDAYSVKIGDDVLKYDKAALTESFLASKVGEAAPLYEDFTAKLSLAGGFYAFSDSKTGQFVSYNDIQAKFLAAKAAGEAFVVDAYTESVDAQVLEVPTVNKVVVKDGKIVIEVEGKVTAELRVEAVSAINARQLEIRFNKAIDKDTVINDNGTKDTADDLLKANMVDIIELDTQGASNIITEGNLKAKLSADGRVLTLTAGTTEFFNGRYSVAVLTNVKDADKIALKSKTTTNINVNDTVRPTLVGVKYSDYNTAKVEFSEQIQNAGTVTFKRADGNDIVGTLDATKVSLSDGKIVIDLSALNTKDENKDIIVTIVGAVDFNGNVVSPNPVIVTVKKDTTDSTKPTVSAITVTGSTTFDIKFSEKLVSAPTIGTVGGNGVTLVKDTTDETLYHATIDVAVTGLQTVNVTAFTDLSANSGDAYTKAVNFDADTTAPRLSSARVEQLDGIEYLVLTYNENVTPVGSKSFAPTYLDNYVTTPATPISTTVGGNFTLYKPVDGKSTAVKLDLTSFANNKTYTVDLVAGIVKDLYGNDSAKVSGQSFTRTSNSSTNAPKLDTTFDVNGVKAGAYDSTVDNNKIVVQFDRPVNGLSAITASNYTVEGATVTSAVLKANTTVGIVELTLAKNSNTLTGARTITVSGVKSQAGIVMDTKTISEALTENVLPTITKAELKANNAVKITFSEDVDQSTVAASDFVAKVGGATVSIDSVAMVNAGENDNEAIITLSSALSADQYTQAITIEKATGFAISDVNGNAMDDFTPITVIK